MKIILNRSQFEKWVQLFPEIYYNNCHPSFMSGYNSWFEQTLNIVSFYNFMAIYKEFNLSVILRRYYIHLLFAPNIPGPKSQIIIRSIEFFINIFIYPK